ncbi:MAG: TRAP-type mannitol/chloroaromatic compound transport system permease small subunit [Alphaproteobacteria bacterium]|jgi:TRAP-type mannitol/chloroaromatic compound transport system permease small subunit
MTATTLDTRSWEIGNADLLFRIVALTIVTMALAFLFNNYLIFWRDWPGIVNFFSHQGWFGFEPLQKPLTGEAVTLGWLQMASYWAIFFIVIGFVLATRDRSLRSDSERFSALASYIIRVAFWSVLLIGLADSVISFLRVEDFLGAVVGDDLAKQLAQSRFRGTFVHYPLILVSLVIAYFVRALGFTWLALLVVLAEFQIVIVRFIFSYEQAFLGDLVRFWYAALFLFASAYTLIEEGHVRVDVLYTGFDKRGKAWINAVGSMLLGIPLCWTILALGMWGKATVINSPLLAFETTQSGFGLYVKYLMAGFLAIYALSMMVQFTGYFLSNVADLRGEPGGREPAGASPH